MSGHSIEPGTAALPLTPTTAAAILSRRLAPPAVWAGVTVIALSLGIYIWRFEADGVDFVFVGAVTLTLGALIVAISRRPLFAAVLAVAMVAIIRAVSYIKQQTTELVLHAYDVVSLLGSWAALAEFWSDHRRHAVALLLALIATAIVGWIVYRIDSVRVPRAYAAGAAVLLIGLGWAAAAAKGDRRHTEIYFESLYVSFFYSSWSETVEALWRRGLIEAAGQPQIPLAKPGRCEPASKPPHIILIHQESVVPPAHFRTLDYDRSLDPFFQSADGELRKLRVETFGGASWRSEFSLLTGLPTLSFGGMHQFVQPFMAGKIQDTLPQALARCGYRTMLLYPMLRNFLASGKFFERAGLSEIRDAKDQGATLPNERDRFYYANALAEMKQHVQASSKPLFMYIQTMAAHGAYDYAYMPEVVVPGGGRGTHPEMHEYLRRLAMAHMDYRFLRAELSRRFPDQQFLIVHYGDHHPTATRTLLGFGEGASIEDVMRGNNPAALTTYYAVDAVRYRLPALAALESVDIAFLGTMLLEAARLPFSDAYRERKRLMLLCNGRYHDCTERDEILKFHRRLVDGGLVDPS